MSSKSLLYSKPPGMVGILLVAFICSGLVETSYGQVPQQRKLDSARIKRGIENIQDSLSEKAEPDSIVRYVDSLLKDNAFVNRLISASLSDSDAFVYLDNKGKFPVRPLGWTSDFEHVFSATQITELDSIIDRFEYETGNEIAIVTLDSSWTTRNNFDLVVFALHNIWGVGKRYLYNGIVIGISTGLKKIRISNGYGIAKVLTDEETKTIIDKTILPEFMKGHYYDGTKKGLLKIMNRIR